MKNPSCSFCQVTMQRQNVEGEIYFECPQCGHTEDGATVEENLSKRMSPDKLKQWISEMRAAVEKA